MFLWYVHCRHSVILISISLTINIPQLIALVLVYLTCVHFFWKPENSAHFVVAGQSMWIAIAGYLSSFLGALQVPVFLMVMAYVTASTAYHLQTREESGSYLHRLQKLFDKNDFERSLSNFSICGRLGSDPLLSPQSEVEDISLSDTVDSTDTFDAKNGAEIEGHQSETFFKLLFYACLGTFLYRNVWMFILAAIPILLHLIYTIGVYTGITQFACSKINEVYLALRVSIYL